MSSINSTPGCIFVMIIFRQTTATSRNMESNIRTSCLYYVQPVVHRFSIFWCIHHMYSATIAQALLLVYKLVSNSMLFDKSMLLCPCLCTDYAIVQFSHHVVLSCIWPTYKLLTQMSCRPELQYSVNIL